MNKKAAVQKLQIIANYLDNNNLHLQADTVTRIMTKIAQSYFFSEFGDEEKAETGPKTPPIIEEEDSNTEEIPSLADMTPTQLNLGGEIVNLPPGLETKGKMKFGNQIYSLYYDKNKKEFYYLSADGKKGVPLDSNGKVKEVRNKKKDWWKQIGIRGLFGDWRLPNLSKSIPVEPYLRKKAIPEISRAVRPLGNAIRDTVTRPVTDILGAAGDELGIKSPSRDDPYMADAKFNLGNSENRETVPNKVPNTGDRVETDIKFQEPVNAEPVQPPDPSPNDEVTNIVRSKGSELKNINSPNDLLFWCMSTSLGIAYGPGLAQNVREKPEYYYNRKNMSKIVDMIVKLAESPSVAKINPRIKGYRRDAIQKLYEKIRESETVK